MTFSPTLWLACRRPVISHLRGGALALAAVAAAALLPAPAWRTAGLTLAAVALLYFGFVLLALAGTVLGLGDELRRKSLHLLGGGTVVGLFVATGSAPAAAALCAVLAAWALLAPRAARLRGLHQLSLRRRDGSRSAGELLFPLALGGTALAAGAPTAAWLAGALVLVLSDSAAALVGRRWGRLRFATLGGRKSLEGCAAFFACTLAIAFGLAAALPGPPQALTALLAFASLLTAVEAASAWGLDNLTIPLAAFCGWAWLLG